MDQMNLAEIYCTFGARRERWKFYLVRLRACIKAADRALPYWPF